MTAKMHNTVGNEHNNSPVTGKTGAWNFQGKISIPVLLGLLLFVALSLVILSVDEELETVAEAPDSGEAIALSEPTIPPQEFSPLALEDLRSAPIDDLTINPEPLLLDPLPEEAGDVTDDDVQTLVETAPEALEVESPAPPEEPFSIGEALARYLLVIRNELNSEYVADCIRFRNRNGLDAGCPENPAITAAEANLEEKALVDDLFAIITRQSDYARISRQLERENETLAAILDDPANPAALQASTKLALNNSYLAYLNGNPNPDVAMFEKMNDFINDYNRTILVGPTQFRCQGGPCIYEYTEPEAQ